MLDESVDVAPSEENGNVTADAPNEPTSTTDETPADPTPVATEPELFDLPDGRKVDAATLATEFKQNFLPEFTRKSQELAQLKQGTLPKTEAPPNPYADPTYVPQTYEEIIKVAEERALQSIEKREADRIAEQNAIETAVIEQLNEVKGIDPSVNENQLFLHANKYGFRDLRTAHQNMKDMSELAKKVQTTTAQNIHKRADPVSISPGATGTAPNPGSFASAVDYVRSLKK